MPATDDTLWLLFSQTKMITAAALWQLVDDPTDLTFDHNTGFATSAVLMLAALQKTYVTVRNNVNARGDYGIFGSGQGDHIRGTRGWDAINAGRGPDVVDLRNGGRDRVACGGGHDKVIVKRGDHDDRIAPSCERVVKR